MSGGKAEMRKRKWEVGSGKWEVGSGKWEVGNRKSEVGSGKGEVGSGKAEMQRKAFCNPAFGPCPAALKSSINSTIPQNQSHSSPCDCNCSFCLRIRGVGTSARKRLSYCSGVSGTRTSSGAGLGPLIAATVEHSTG